MKPLMSEIVNFEPEKLDDEDYEPALDAPIDMRPDLGAIGLHEHERGVVEDSYENRQALRAARLRWDPVYSSTGAPTGLIAARSEEQQRERRVLSLQEKKPLLVDSSDKNSDYLTGLGLLLEDEALRITPPWVAAATRKFLDEQERGGPSSPKRAALVQPQRCRIVKTDGVRCMLWSSGRIKDDGLCRMHLKTQRKPGEDVERARRKLIQGAPYAVDVLEDLMENAVSEPVKLKASTEILDRAGIRGGMDLSLDVEVTDARTPAQIIGERLLRLASGAARTASAIPDTTDIVDAEVVTDEVVAAASVEEKVILKSPAAVNTESNSTDSEDSGVDSTDSISDDELEELGK
jgi:hypothetical protein